MRELGKSYFVPTFKRNNPPWMMRGFRVWNGVRCDRQGGLYYGRKLTERYRGPVVIPDKVPRVAWRKVKHDARSSR